MKSSTQLSLVAAAVSAVLGTAAHALPPANFTDGTIAASNFYYAGGGSAEVQAVFVAVNGLLQSATVDVYTDAAATAPHPQSANYLVISGKTASTNAIAGGAPGFPANTNVAFIYKYSGGSFPNGAQVFVTGGTLAYPAAADLAGGAVIGGGGHTSLNPGYRYSSTNGNNQTPAWGITDEEPGLFNFWWNLNGLTQPQSLAGITKQGLWVAPFGIAVTDALYAKKKQWSRGEVAGVLAGTISDWSQMTDDTGTALPAGSTIIIDRGSGSGTKAAGNEFFLNYPGGAFSLGGSIQPHSVGSNTAVNAGITGTTLCTAASCLTALQDIKEASGVAEADDLIVANQHGLFALAVEGLEFPPAFEQHTAGTNDYEFVAIDGSFVDSNTGTADNINSPLSTSTTQYSNVTNGKYPFAFQPTFNYKVAPANNSFAKDIQTNLTNENLAGAHTGTGFPGGTDGILLDPVTTGNTDAGNNNWSRGGNSNQPPLFNAVVTAAKPDPL
jgi:hypothetical protein